PTDTPAIRFRRKNRLAVLNSGTVPPLLPTTLIRPPYPSMAITRVNREPPTLSTAMSTLFGLIAAVTAFTRFLSPGSQTKSARSVLSLSRFAILRDRATTVRFIDFPSSTDATPTPPDAPVTRRTDPVGRGAGGSRHCVNACHAVRKTNGAPAISSTDQ